MSEKIWVWPHQGGFHGDCGIYPSDVDEMQLVHQEGMTLGDVKQSALEAFLRMESNPEGSREWLEGKVGDIKGAWLVPDLVNGKPLWELIGAMMSTATGRDGEDYVKMETAFRLVDALAVGHIGEPPVEDYR